MSDNKLLTKNDIDEETDWSEEIQNLLKEEIDKLEKLMTKHGEDKINELVQDFTYCHCNCDEEIEKWDELKPYQIERFLCYLKAFDVEINEVNENDPLNKKTLEELLQKCAEDYCQIDLTHHNINNPFCDAIFGPLGTGWYCVLSTGFHRDQVTYSGRCKTAKDALIRAIRNDIGEYKEDKE